MDRLLRFSYICPAHVYNSHCAAAAGWHLREENDEKEGEREKEGGRLVRRRERETRGYASTKREGSGLWWEGGERGRGVEGWERIGRVGGLERVRGHGSYGIALTFDLIPLPASLETPCRPLPSVPRAPTLLRNRLECETLATDRESSRPGNIRKGGARDESADSFLQIFVGVPVYLVFYLCVECPVQTRALHQERDIE